MEGFIMLFGIPFYSKETEALKVIIKINYDI